METAETRNAVGADEVGALYRHSVEWWSARVAAVTDDQWDLPTPCSEWSVRDLVNHVVGEDLWTSPLMRGETIEQVGDRFDGDLLGDDPREAGRQAALEATSTVDATLHSHGTVHLSYGEESMDEYIRQLTADHLVHGWDLAAATGADRDLDSDLVDGVGSWFEQMEEAYRGSGAVAARGALSGDPQSDLLARFGRDARWGPNHAGFAAFNAAFARGDVAGIMAQMSDDCVFESTGPAPDGVRYEGASAVRAVWEELFTHTREPRFIEEESFVDGEHGVVRWRYEWTTDDGSTGHVRGMDLMRLRDGKVSEKRSYVKG